MHKIMLIEDDQDTQMGLSMRLKANGYKVVMAVDAAGSIKLAREEAPDLILLDLGLPAGDGYIVMQRLKMFPQLANIPIVVLTARGVEENRDRSLASGAAAFFQKPADNEKLMDTIAALVGRESIEV